MANYLTILSNFNIVPKDKSLYEQAFSHPSYANEKKNSSHYERIEFIGDGVLDLVVADLIFRNHSDMDQGLMSKLRSAVVKRESLANYARKYGLGDAIRLGNGQKIHGGSNLDKILEDVFEAFVGAVYLDQGFDVVYKLIKEIFMDDVMNLEPESLTDYKSKLQELVQADTRETVKYHIISESGTPQNKIFEVEVLHEGQVLGRGSGSSKKRAEQAAAKDALDKVVR